MLIFALLFTSPVLAEHQDRPAHVATEPPSILEDVIVTGPHRGDTGFSPDVVWGVDDIDALGAYDVGEVVRRLAEQLNLESPPVLIVNGRRIVNPDDFLRFPPDALVRLEALPDEASGEYGAGPTQRVFNVVLQSQFKSRDGQAAATGPTAGGTATLDGDLRQSEIHDLTILQFGVQATRTTPLWINERPGYRRDHPDARDRTLTPATSRIGTNVSITRPFGNWSGAFSLAASREHIRFLAASTDGSIDQSRQRNDSIAIAAGLTGEASGWNVRAGLNAFNTRYQQRGIRSTASTNRSMIIDLNADRRLRTTSAGPIRINLGTQHVFARGVTDIDETQTVEEARDHDLRASLDLPLARSRPGLRTDFGNAALTLGARLHAAQSDTLDQSYSASLVWSPMAKARLTAQRSFSIDAPSPGQRLEPEIQGATRVVFDYLQGSATEVQTTFGGNAGLNPQRSARTVLGVFLGPITPLRLTAGSTFTGTETRNGIGGLPELTAEVEAAFPERILRDDMGRLTSLDLRPVNIALTGRKGLASFLNLTIPIGERGDRGAAFQIGLQHNLQLSNTVIVRDGFIELDRLAGDGGGQPRHEVSLNIHGSVERWRANFVVRWRDKFRSRRYSGRDSEADLLFDSITSVDLRASYSINLLTLSSELTPGQRNNTVFELSIENLLDSRTTARLGSGRPAPGYGRFDRDQIGRTISLRVIRRF